MYIDGMQSQYCSSSEESSKMSPSIAQSFSQNWCASLFSVTAIARLCCDMFGSFSLTYSLYCLKVDSLSDCDCEALRGV